MDTSVVSPGGKEENDIRLASTGRAKVENLLNDVFLKYFILGTSSVIQVLVNVT